MITATHMSVGAAAAVALQLGPLPAFVVGVGSHALLDMVPHQDVSQPARQAVVLVAGLGLVWTMYMHHSYEPLLWGAFGGLLPDVEVALRHFGWTRGNRFPTHTGRLPHGRVGRPVYGYAIELACILAAAGYVLFTGL